MYIFKKPIAILYVLFSIVVMSLAFQNCSSPFENSSSSASFGGGGTLSVNEVKSVEIFEKTLFDKITAAGVIADWREPDVIRIAPVPLYNRFEDCYRFVECLEELAL